EVALLASSAFFLPDGKTLIHPLAYGFCQAYSGAIGIARYDLTTHQEQIVTLDDSTVLAAFGPHGDVVYGSMVQGTQLLSWQSPPSAVPVDPGAFYLFTEDDRYLISFAFQALTVRDLSSGVATTQAVDLYN